jgi:hypothetical protein
MVTSSKVRQYESEPVPPDKKKISILNNLPIPPKTKHYIGLPPELSSGRDERHEMPLAAFLVIEEFVDYTMLIRYSVSGDYAGDTWHMNLQDAFEQASFEYGERIGAWDELPSDVGEYEYYAAQLPQKI